MKPLACCEKLQYTIFSNCNETHCYNVIMSLMNKNSILRVTLLCAGLGWGLTIVGAFLPWEWATEHLEKFGGSGEIPNDVMLNY